MPKKSDTRGEYIDEMYRILDKKVVEAFDKGNDMGQIRASKMATYMEVNERTLRRNGFPDYFDEEQKGCTWKKMKGLRVNLEKYIKDRNLLDKISKRTIEEEEERI